MIDADLLVPTYIGRKACGCVIAAVVDDGTMKKEVAAAVAEFIQDGLSIERVTVGWVRSNKFGCDHEVKQDAPTQAELFPAASSKLEGVGFIVNIRDL